MANEKKEEKKQDSSQNLPFEMKLAVLVSGQIKLLMVGEIDMAQSREMIRNFFDDNFDASDTLTLRMKMDLLRQAAEAIAQEFKMLSVQR